MQEAKDLTGFSHIEVFGAREHNLKNIDVKIPRKKKAGSPMEMKMPHIEMMMPPMKTKKGKKGMME